MTGSVSSFQQNKNEKLISTFSPRISRKTTISNAEIQNGEFRKSTGDDQNVQNRNQNRDMGVSADQVSITTLIKLVPVQGKNNRAKKSMVAPILPNPFKKPPNQSTYHGEIWICTTGTRPFQSRWFPFFGSRRSRTVISVIPTLFIFDLRPGPGH